MNTLTLADLPHLERMIARTATPAETLDLLEKVYGASVREMPLEELPALITAVGERLNTLTRADDVRARVLAHLWAGGPRPFEYLTLRLCREVYFCPPEMVLCQPLDVVLAHLACLEVEAALVETQTSPLPAPPVGCANAPPTATKYAIPAGLTANNGKLNPPLVQNPLAPTSPTLYSVAVGGALAQPTDSAPPTADGWRDSIPSGGRIAEWQGDAVPFLHATRPLPAATLFEDGADAYSIGAADNPPLPISCNETTTPVSLGSLRGRGV